METLVNKELSLTAKVDGDISYNKDGSINYVWNVKTCEVYDEANNFLFDVTQSNDSPAHVAKFLKDFVKVS